jgi:peptidyl-prolyl cis-trans isomerase D
VTAGLTLSRQELEGYLQNHQAEFRTPERVSISYLLIDPRKVAAGLTVSSEEAESFYQKNIDRYQGKGGILPYAEVQARAKADALQLKAVKQAYEMAADAINKHQKDADPNAMAKALGLPLLTTPLFTAKEQPVQLAGETEVLTKAFFLQPGQLGGPVETKKGVYILALKERQPATVPPLAAIKVGVERGAAVEKAQQLARKKAEEAQATLAKGTGALKLQETGLFGYANSGVIPKIGKAPAIMETAFSLTTASPAPPTPFKIGERWYAVRLKGRTEANTADFQKLKEQLKQQMLPQKREEALRSWLEGLKKKAKIEINPTLTAE